MPIQLIIYFAGFIVTWIVNQVLIELKNSWACEDQGFLVMIIIPMWPIALIVIALFLFYKFLRAGINPLSRGIALCIQKVGG